MAGPENTQSREVAPATWSILDGQFDPQNVDIDIRRFIEDKKVADNFPESARERYRAAQTVIYAYELCNQADLLKYPALVESSKMYITKTAMQNHDATQVRLAQMVGVALDERVADAPVIRALSYIFTEGLVEETSVQLRCLAIVGRLLERQRSTEI